MMIPLRKTGGRILRTLASLVLITAISSAQVQTPAELRMPQSHSPLGSYMPNEVPEPVLTNSQRLQRLIHDGKLYLSLKDAIDLALENNLDLAIARYNLPIADSDVLRTKAGATFRGVNTGVVQGTPGGGVGGFGTGAPGAGAGGTTSGAGGAGAGAAGLVQSTLGVGTPVSSYDPQLNVNAGIEHLTLPQSNLAIYGVPSLQLNTTAVNANFSQAFSSGTAVSFEFTNNRQTTNSSFIFLSPALNSYYRLTIQQQLLAGFGFGPNLRYLRIARNNKKISDIAFKDQVIATVTQIENIYWDLVNAYEQARVNEQSLDFANQTLENDKKQLQLEAIPQMDVMKAEAEVSQRDQDLTIARTNLQLQESLMKNALTKSLDDPTLQEMPVIPTDRMQDADMGPVSTEPIADLMAEGLKNRPELLETDIDLTNRQISRKAARNALLPSLSLVGYYAGTGLGGIITPGNSSTLSLPNDLYGT
ncbi:MAG: TolC family protein, partial [Terriglobales bacterium]